MMLPNPGLGARSPHIEADAFGHEIGVDSGSRGTRFAIEGANRREGISIHTSGGRLEVLGLARDAEDAKVVADRDEGRVALDAKPSLVLAVDGVTSKRAVWTEAVEVLSMDIEVNCGDEQVSLSEVSLATAALPTA